MNMLAYSKPREPRLQLAQVNKIVADAVALAQRKADEKSVMLLADLQDPFPAIPIDVDGIHQVALNLITNAIDAVASESGLVNVETRFDAEKERAILDIKDNGPGISVENRRRMFEPFYSTKGQGGTGLGLAVAQKIVQEHRGRIEVISQIGEGTIMRVILPIAAGPGESSDATFGPPK
jgi:signal transduction histidine kinase